ncbi:ATP synthase subunit I [Alteribacter aurantiacus]|uniref:ATP synthase subunit I n=1 Tax=Alteribacter aurantiacus TaxID=254410 RepID=UPI0004793EAE|nr:ATP synthase subunit I [Alteribacter aurantiacus]
MEFRSTARRITMYAFVLIIVYALLALVTPYETLFMGLILGTAFSILNLYVTYTQVKRVSNSALQGTKFAFGTATRIVIAVICILTAVSFPDLFNLAGALIGLMSTYAIIMIEPVFHIKRLQ